MTTNPNPAFKKNILAGLAVPTSVKDPELRRFLGRLKEHIELMHGNKGQPFERFATLQDLKNAGIASDLAVLRGRGQIAKTANSERARSGTASASSGVTRLRDLADVRLLGAVSTGQQLTYDAQAAVWQNKDDVVSSGQDADDTAIAFFMSSN